MVEIVATDAALDRRYRLLSSMPGVGPVLACTLIALLPELGRMSRKQSLRWSASRPMPSRAARSREGATSGAVVRTFARCSTRRR
jgi:transposase